LLFLSCTRVAIIKEEKPTIKNRIGEEYYLKAKEAFKDRDISNTLRWLIIAKRKDPGNRDIEDDFKKIIDSLESDVYYKNITIKKGEGIRSPLQFLIFYRENDKIYPAKNIPVYFHFLKGKGVMSEESITDDMGIAKCFVDEIKDFDKEVIIEACVEFEDSGEGYRIDSLTRRYKFSNITLFDQPQTLIVSIDYDKGHDIQDLYRIVCNELLELFINRGFSNISCIKNIEREVFDKAFNMDRLYVRVLGNKYNSKIVTLVKIAPSLVKRSSIDFFLSEAEVSAKIVDVMSLDTLLEYRTTQKGAGQNELMSKKRAIENAINDLKNNTDHYINTLRRGDEL